MDWRAKLTKKEKAHLRENGFRVKAQLEQMMRDGSGKPPTDRCMECKMIARKLGMETDPGRINPTGDVNKPINGAAVGMPF